MLRNKVIYIVQGHIASYWPCKQRGHGCGTLALRSLLAIDRLNPYGNHIECPCVLHKARGLSLIRSTNKRFLVRTKWSSVDWSTAFNWCRPQGRVGLGRNKAGETGDSVPCSCFCSTDLLQAFLFGGALSFLLWTLKAVSEHVSLQTG